MIEVLVLGIGNRLMMDDGMGVYVTEELKKRNTNPGIRYVVGETDIYFCLKQIKEVSSLIIVDAACLHNEPGSIITIPFYQVYKNREQLISIHDSHLFNEMIMEGKSFEGMLIGIEPYEIKYGIGLSIALQDKFPEIVDKIQRIIVSYTSNNIIKPE